MPIDNSLASRVRKNISSLPTQSGELFSLLSQLCAVVNSDPQDPVSHDLVLRAMEHREAFGEMSSVLDGLVRNIGLFPYLDRESLSLADAIAYESHRPIGFDDDIVFHRAQAHIYHLLLRGENVALSAPTSFGKSLIIDAIIASGKHSHIAIVVPALALIDETRRRLASRFGNKYKIITRTSQSPSPQNIYILTQERVLEFPNFDSLDFFVIDEFYKLSVDSGDKERAILLNNALYKLLKTGAQFYMLGPNIDAMNTQNHMRVELRFVKEPHYHTVATQVHRVKAGDGELATLTNLCNKIEGATIIFCKSPDRAAEVAKHLSTQRNLRLSKSLQNAIEWIDTHFHPEWHFSEALSKGIGVHHGRIPRSLGQYVVRKFNDGEIDILVCTSTLIEGVNTKARNIVVFDNTINKKRIDRFTFNNIKGRSGRMFEFFVGHVYVFHVDPQQDLPRIEIPIFPPMNPLQTPYLCKSTKRT